MKRTRHSPEQIITKLRDLAAQVCPDRFRAEAVQDLIAARRRANGWQRARLAHCRPE